MQAGVGKRGGGHHVVLYLFIFHPAAPHQESVAVDSVGGAGHQGGQVFSFLRGQGGGVGGLHYGDAIHPVADGLIQDVEEEHVPLLQLIQVGEQGRAGESSVGGYHGMAPPAAYGEGASLQVACGFLEDCLFCGMVDGDLDADLRDFHIAHHAVAGEVQAGEVGFVGCIPVCGGGEGVGQHIGLQGFVVGQRGRFLACVIDFPLCGLGCQGFVVGGDEFALAVVVPFVGNQGIQQQGQAGQEQ